jgi:hypothetical protein
MLLLSRNILDLDNKKIQNLKIENRKDLES